jgi:hypothetical protein
MKTFIVPNKTTGSLITKYKAKPGFGFIQLKSETLEVGNGWVRKKTRSALVRAEVEHLELFVKNLMKADKSVPGFICVQEFKESEVPESWSKRLNQTLEYEERVKSYVKRASDNGIELLADGERILRFTDFMMSGDPTEHDIFVAHDNSEEIKAAQAAAKAGEGANLDGSDESEDTTADVDAAAEEGAQG